MTYTENPAAYDEDRPARKPQRDGRHTIAEHLDQLDREVMLLGETVEQAQGVLGLVMRPEEPSPVDPEGKLTAIRQQSQLGDRIEAATARVRDRARILAGLLDRLDL